MFRIFNDSFLDHSRDFFCKILLLILVLLPMTVKSQEHSIIVSGTFKQVSFKEFVNDLEQHYPVQFFFDEEWISDVKVDFDAKNDSLKTVLREVLGKYKIHYIIDGSGNVFLYKGDLITEAFPVTVIEHQERVDSNQQKTTNNIQDRYLGTNKKKETESFVIGQRASAMANQTYIINGRVFNEATGEPVIGATFYIRELSKGAVSDVDGLFNIRLKTGKYLCQVNNLSMREKNIYLEVYGNGTIAIPMEREVLNINEVKIVADRNDNVSGIQMGFERLSANTIKEIPAVMGERDILKVAQMLPGVQSAGEGSAGIIVRGGSADQNLFYINKVPVFNTSHLFGFFSSFSPDIINNFSLYKSNIPAQYGGRLSSVFDITTRPGNKKEFFGKGGISPITGHIMIEGPVIKDKSSFVFSYRGTYSDWLLSRIKDINIQNSDAKFYDVSFTSHSEINDKNFVKAFFYKSHDRFSLALTNDYEYDNNGVSVNWKHFFNSSLNADITLVNSNYSFSNNNKTNPSEAYNQTYSLNHLEAKTDFTYLAGRKNKITFGAGAINYTLDRGNISPYGELSRRIPVDLPIEYSTESAVYVADEYSITSRLTLMAGLRYSLYSTQGPTSVNHYKDGLPKTKMNITNQEEFEKGEIVKWYHGPEPRAALNVLLGRNNSVKFSYNRIQQYIFMLSNTISLSPTDQWKLSDTHTKPLVSDQISIGYYQDFLEKGITTSCEIYTKKIQNVLEYMDGADFISSDPAEMYLLQGDQQAYGIELMMRKKTGKLTGWTSYTYSHSAVTVDNINPELQINFGETYLSNYDKPHSFNLVANYHSSRRVGYATVITYSSGRPITYPVALYYSGTKQVLHYSSRNEYRIPDYFRVDFSLTYEGNLKANKMLHSTWMLNFYNLLGRDNAYSVYYEALEGRIQGYKLSIFAQPIVTLTWNFKFGNYVSE